MGVYSAVFGVRGKGCVREPREGLHQRRERGKTSDVESAWGHETAPVTEWGHNGDLSGPAVVAAPVRVISEAAHIDEVPRLTRNQRSVMDWLAEGRDVSLRDLSERLPRAPITVKSLFHRGLVGYGQRWDEADGTSDLDRTVRLTPRGKTAMDLLEARDHESD